MTTGLMVWRVSQSRKVVSRQEYLFLFDMFQPDFMQGQQVLFRS